MDNFDFVQLVADQTPDATVVTAPDRRVLYWNRAAEEVFGYAAAEALQQDLMDLIVPPRLPGAELAHIDAAMSLPASSHLSIRRARDGGLLYIDCSTKAVHDAGGAPLFVLWTMKDVTRKKIAAHTSMAGTRFGALLDLMPDAIVMANAVGRIVLANRQAGELFGYDSADMHGRLLEDLMPERYRARHVGQRGAYAVHPQVRPMGAGRELHGLRASGDEFPVEISLSPVQTEDGVLVMSAIRDISERKRIELALHERNVELADASLAKDRFLSSMSHELRTPLNAILGFTGTMLMGLPGPVNEQQSHQLRTIQTSARHLLSLINDILDITKIASGKVELSNERFDCRDLIDGVAAMFAPLADQKGIRLLAPRASQPLQLCIDRRAVQQIVINLINNAIKFTEEGSVEVQVSMAADDPTALLIEVRDTGIGIAMEQLDLVFQPFTQLDQGNTRQFEGTGLGLHLSKRLAELIGGRIAVHSVRGEGSTFSLRLPGCAVAD